jgi:hypothetical protein
MAEIPDDFIISNNGLKRPLMLAENFDVSDEALQRVIQSALRFQNTISDTSSLKQLEKETKKLIADQKLLIKTQEDLFKKVDKLEKENNQLKESLKKLTQETKKNQDANERLGNSVDALDNRVNGLIGRTRQLAKELWVIAKHPVVLMVAGLVGLFAAAGNAVKTFYTTTGEGEDVLARQEAVWNQFFVTLRTGWGKIGKSISDALGEDALQGFLYHVLRMFSQDMATTFLITSTQAKKLADELDAVQDRISQNIIQRSITERREAELLKASVTGSAKERLEALLEYNKIKQEQLQIDVEIAQDEYELLLIKTGLEHDITKERALQLDYAERLALFNGDEVRALAEAKARVIQLGTAFDEETKKSAARVNALREQIHKDEVDKATKRAEDFYKIQKGLMDNEIEAVEKAVIAGVKTREDGDKEILRIHRKFSDDLIQAQIDGLNELLDLGVLNDEEQLAALEKLNVLKLELTKAFYEQVDDVTVESTKVTLDKMFAAYSSFVSSVQMIYQSAHSARLSQIDEEQRRIEESYDRQIAMAGNNTERKAELENELAKKISDINKKRIEQERKAAIFQKAVGFVQAGINVALAATNQGAKGDPYTALARVAAIVAALAPFVASIASKDIPAYKDGTGPGGTTAPIIKAGEEGFEFYRTPKGKWGVTPDKTTIMSAPVGTQVFDHKTSMGMIAASALGVPDSTQVKNDDAFIQELARHFGSLENTIRNKPSMQMNFKRGEIERMLQNAQTRTWIMNQLYK